ncbi:hypothetical protein QYE76_007434 [Lolium multiflorum]|uniref:DDE Tnp4 domain-containing protein n=1 Tax=Lolium multiflorum TaxID=4521 RepID=A0AAD8RZ06_LOLMU|nr:hypothetical protein QYE76_007434 [Lolium multiflorum]
MAGQGEIQVALRGKELLPSVSDVGPGSSFPATAEPAHIFSDFPLSPFSAMTETDRLQLVHHATALIICIKVWILMVHKRAVRHADFPPVMYAPMLQRVGELRGEMIKPTSVITPPNIKNSYRLFSYFRDCIGAIDGTHVTAKVPRSMSAAFHWRKHYTSQNVLAAVDFDMRFTYVLAGWEGSAHDASILSDSL